MMALEEANMSIHQAAKDGELELLSKFPKKQFNQADKDGWTPVHWCAWAGNVEPLELVLSKGGDPNKCDIRGQTPLHVAATYGNCEALEVLIQHRGNIWALDNTGLHPAKLAANKRQLDCCRLLDSIAIQFESYNADYVRKEQNKAVKDMEKRIKEMERGAANYRPRMNPLIKEQRARSNSDSKGRRSNQKQSAASNRENFLLVRPLTNENGEDDDEADEADSQIADLVTRSAKNTLRPLPKMHSGAMLNTLSDLARNPMRIDPDDLQASSSDPILVQPRANHTSTPTMGSPAVSRVKAATIGSIVPLQTQEIEIEHDSSLVTFLHSLGVVQVTQALLDQRMDMESLALCTDEDLDKIGILLGPRKKILRGLEERERLMHSPGEMTDSNF